MAENEDTQEQVINPDLLERIKKYAADYKQVSYIAATWQRQIDHQVYDEDEFLITVHVFHDAGQVAKWEWDRITTLFPEWFK